MPPQTAIKTETKAAPETSTAGVFDHLPPAEQATKDAATVEAAETSETTEETDTSMETTDGKPEQSKEGETSETQEEGTEEGSNEEDGAQAKEIVVHGRTFKSADELATAYEKSSEEGVRLDRLLAAETQEKAALKARIVELEDKEGSSPYPKTLTKEALEALSQAEQTQYMLDKRDWEQNQAKAKEQREKTRQELKAYQEDLKNVIANNTSRMESQPETYPGFKESADIRNEILRRTPWLNGWPETPYVVWLMSRGIDSISKDGAKTKADKTATEMAKRVSEAAAASAKGGKTSTGKGTTEEPSSIVKSYHARNSGF